MPPKQRGGNEMIKRENGLRFRTESNGVYVASWLEIKNAPIKTRIFWTNLTLTVQKMQRGANCVSHAEMTQWAERDQIAVETGWSRKEVQFGNVLSLARKWLLVGDDVQTYGRFTQWHELCEHCMYHYTPTLQGLCEQRGGRMSGGIAAELKVRIYSWQWRGGFGDKDV